VLADVAAGSLLAEDDVRALLDPPGRRAAAAEASPAVEHEPEESEAEPSTDFAAYEDGPPTAKAPELDLVNAPKSVAEPADAAPSERAATSSIDEIIDYWDSLRGDRPSPSIETLDRSHVSRTWPNCLLVAFTTTENVTPRLTRLGEANGQVEYTAMVIDWIISRGRHSVKRGEPMEEEKRFPVTGGNARYQLLLLPLRSQDGKSDHVLCHLCRVRELSAGAAFKRWLAS
jgi:hypothetical protein